MSLRARAFSERREKSTGSDKLRGSDLAGKENLAANYFLATYLRFWTPSLWFSSNVSFSEILFASLIVFSESESSILSGSILPPSIAA